jgi:mRNA-degrading endonuclease RelE of RelBE toxin-antitoxin system
VVKKGLLLKKKTFVEPNNRGKTFLKNNVRELLRDLEEEILKYGYDYIPLRVTAAQKLTSEYEKLAFSVLKDLSKNLQSGRDVCQSLREGQGRYRGRVQGFRTHSQLQRQQARCFKSHRGFLFNGNSPSWIEVAL